MDVAPTLAALGVTSRLDDGELIARSPIDGSTTARLALADPAAVTAAIDRAQAAFEVWRTVPAPRRGELVRLFGEELRAHKDQLATLITIEAGKIVAEARGEVQEMIDIYNITNKQTHQHNGLAIASERPGHR